MRHLVFVLVVLVICLGGYAAALGIGASRAYCTHSTNFLDAVPCYGSEPAGQTADLLLAGDSSLLYGISPALVAADGGGSVYNLGTVGPGFGFDPDMLIDRYLAHNVKPRAIILYLSPWDRLSKTEIEDPRWAQLGIFLLQHGRIGEIAAFLRALPSALVELPPIVVAGLGPHAGPTAAVAAQMAADRGHLDYSVWMPRALGADCGHGSRPPGAVDNRAALAVLRPRYEAQGIAVFIYVAPTAQCDAALGAVTRAYAGVADNRAQALPDRLFADDVKAQGHVHPSPAGPPVFSAGLAAFLRDVVQPKLAAPR
jgi:hypothetical protein